MKTITRLPKHWMILSAFVLSTAFSEGKSFLKDMKWESFSSNTSSNSSYKILINKQADLNNLDLKDIFKSYSSVEIVTSDRNWLKSISLPQNTSSGKTFKLKVNSTYSVGLDVSGMLIFLKKGEEMSLTYYFNKWHVDQGFKTISLFKQSQINTLKSKKALDAYLGNFETVKVVTSDGNWMKNISLPETTELGKKFILEVNSTYPVTLTVGRKMPMKMITGEKKSFSYHGRWYVDK